MPLYFNQTEYPTMLPWQEFIELLSIAIIANAFSAMAGGGAGLIQFPALIWLGLPFSIALATHKIASVALGLGASVRHLQNKSLNWRMSAWIMAAGIPGVLLGSVLIIHTPDQWARGLLGVFTLGLGIYSIIRPQLGLEEKLRHETGYGWWMGLVGLFAIGILNGSISSGTGLFLTLWLVRWFGLDYKKAVAYTLVLCGIFWNGAGAMMVGMLGSVRWDWLPPLLLGSFIGGWLGTRYAIHKGNQWIKRAFEIATIAVGLKLLFDFFSLLFKP